jgi:hypothetical protein
MRKQGRFVTNNLENLEISPKTAARPCQKKPFNYFDKRVLRDFPLVFSQ